jgi:DNA-binding SARP family transcriptional activator
MVQIYVSRLRQVLPRSILHTRPPGYVLEFDPKLLDLNRFLRLAEQGRAALASGDGGAASDHLRDALALWRGPALREFSEPFAAAEAAHLEELQLSTLESRIDADLLCGRAAQLVGELEALVATQPLRERLRGQLMVALYRSGRQADALGAYQDMRRTLDEELGLRPGPALQQLEQAILSHDASLEQPDGGPERTATPRAGLVGREHELTRLHAALPLATGETGGAVLIVGSPGVGKTRLAQELSVRAADAGARVAWGRCSAQETPPPYWPWSEVIRALARDWSADELAEALGPDAATIARLVPEVGERLVTAPSAPADGDPQQARFRLFDSVTSCLIRAGAREPLLVVLDDLHAADADSLSLLAFLAPRLRDGRLVIAATLRDDEPPLDDPLAQTLGALRRSDSTLLLALEGLPTPALAELVGRHVGRPPPPKLVAELHAATGGNPLLVAEVVRIALADGTSDISDDELVERFRTALPGGLRAAIGLRMSALSADCRDALIAAAVLGSEVTAPRLCALTSVASDDVTLDALEEAVGAGMLAEDPAQPGAHVFGHQLIRDAVLAQLSATRRARLHLRAAEALERYHAAGLEAHAAEIAHHLEAAGALAPPERVAHFCGLGAAAALRAQAYEEAQQLYRLALCAKGGGAMDDQHAELLAGLARAELATLGLHDNRTFREVAIRMRQVFDHYVSAGDVDRAVAIAALPIPPIYRTTSADEYRELTVEALALVAPQSIEAGRLLAAFGWFAGANEADFDTAAEAFETAITIARRYGDPALEMRTLLNAAQVDFQHTRWPECFERATAALALAEQARDARAQTFARVWAARSAMVLGDSASARTHIAASVALAEQLREPLWLDGAHLDATWLAVLEGRWDDARVEGDRALAAEPSDTRAIACRALVEYQCGQRATGDAFLQRLIDAQADARTAPQAVAHNVAGAFVPLLSRLAELGDEHRPVAHEAVERARAAGRMHPLSNLMVHAGLGLLAAADGDGGAAAAPYDELRSQTQTVLLVATTSADRLLGLMAATRGDAGAATEHFECALAFCRAAGYRPEWAWTAHDYVLHLAPEHGQALVEEARAIAHELEMTALLGHLERAHARAPNG